MRIAPSVKRRAWPACVVLALTLAYLPASCRTTPIGGAASDASRDAAFDQEVDASGSGGTPGRDAPAEEVTVGDTAPIVDHPADLGAPSDATDAPETGGTGGANGTGGQSGTAGAGGMTGLGGSGGAGSGGAGGYPPGSCDGQPNPDAVETGACTQLTASVTAGLPCTKDCCLPCGIELTGTKTCFCPTPGFPYSNCFCAPPANFPVGLIGGACSPQGFALATPPITAPPGAISLVGVPCTKINVVCFTAESTPAAERGCICLRDGHMHCGSVNHWFANDNASMTTYN
jgi:hypothetical protein